jgi:hypothetical protein
MLGAELGQVLEEAGVGHGSRKALGGASLLIEPALDVDAAEAPLAADTQRRELPRLGVRVDPVHMDTEELGDFWCSKEWFHLLSSPGQAMWPRPVRSAASSSAE